MNSVSFYDTRLREEKLKNKVAADWFAAFDCTRIIGNIDFAMDIPAESFAAGRNALDGFGNYEYLKKARHGWPKKDKEWHHSDIKNVDYRYVQDFFRHIKEATEQ